MLEYYYNSVKLAYDLIYLLNWKSFFKAINLTQ